MKLRSVEYPEAGFALGVIGSCGVCCTAVAAGFDGVTGVAGKIFDVGCVVVVVELVDAVSEGVAVVEGAVVVEVVEEVEDAASVEELPARGLGARSDSGLDEVLVASSVFLVVFRDLRSFFGFTGLLSAEVTSIGVAVAAGTVSVLLEAAGTFAFDAGEEGDVDCFEDDAPVGAVVGAVGPDGAAGFESDSSFHKDSSEPSWSSATAGNMHAWLTVDARSIKVAATRTALFRTEISLII